jgi:hypothetical protein
MTILDRLGREVEVSVSVSVRTTTGVEALAEA